MNERRRVEEWVEYGYGCKRERGEWGGVVTAVDKEERKVREK